MPGQIGEVKMNEQTYTTIQGDTWDNIALKVYGNEKHADFLMQNNYPALDILVFSSGTILNIPPLPESKNESLPAWRTSKSNLTYDPYD